MRSVGSFWPHPVATMEIDVFEIERILSMFGDPRKLKDECDKRIVRELNDIVIRLKKGAVT